MPQRLLDLFLTGVKEKNAEDKDKEKRKALSGLVDNLATLMKSPEGAGSPTGGLPGAPGAPGGAISPAAGPELMPGVNLPGAPPGGPMSPVLAPTTAPPRAAGAGDLMDTIRQGLFPALAGTGEYAPEAVQMIHNLFGGELFKEQKEVYSHAPGTMITDRKGNVISQVPNKPLRPSFGVSESGWLTLVNEDGTTQELTGVRPPKIVEQEMKGKTAENVANIRGEWAFKSAEERAKAQKTIAFIRQAAGDKINSPAKLYTHLTQKWLDGEATPEEISVLKHLEPVIIKMGGLQMLMEAETGKKANRAPWDPEEAPPPEVQQEYSWWQKLLGQKPGGTGDEKPRTDLPRGEGEVPVHPSLRKDTGPTPGQKTSKIRVNMTLGGKKIKGMPPDNWDTDYTEKYLTKVEEAVKQGKDPQAVIQRMKEHGWIIN